MKKAGQGEPKTTVTKALGDNPARKIPPGKSLKAPSTRYAAQNELREHNQLLASTNEALQKRLHEMQSKCSTLEQERSVLRGENEDILKRLRECHVLLVAENIDPVVGEKICQTSAQDEELRRATMNLSASLLAELKRFDCTMTDLKTQMLEIKNHMKEVNEAREKLKVNSASYISEVKEMELALEEAEALLQ